MEIETSEPLAHLNLKKPFRAYTVEGSDIIYIQTKSPACIINGKFCGTEITLDNSGMFQVWTCHKNKAVKIAETFNLRIKKLNGEAEVYVPASLADKVLPKLGAKTRKDLSEKELKVLKQRLNSNRKTTKKGK